MVYIISKDGKPLMPTNRHGKVKHLLREGKAKVVRKCPFTIKLNYDTTTYVQDVTLGVDTGSKHIGVACIGNDKVLYQSQVELRDNIKTKMDDRRTHRKNRRFRKTRYRKSRFLNRANSKREDRLPPSVKHKVQAHIDEIEFCKKILPVNKMVFEVSQFDTHLLKNPSLINEKVKHWGYQKGFNYGFSSRREAVLNRDGYKCQHCGKKNCRLEVHHIVYRSNDGPDDENNLITLCKECHDNVHKGNIVLTKKPKKMLLKYATQMSLIRSRLLKFYTNAIETFGFVTKENRNHLRLPKTHYMDACVIASGGKEFKLNEYVYLKKRVSKGDYQLTKGVRGEQKIPTGKIKGFMKFDKVKYFGKEYFIKGRMSTGFAILMDIFGNKIDFSYMKKGFKIPKLFNCKRIKSRKSCLCIKQKTIPSIT